MKHKIEIFAASSSGIKKVGCSNCVKNCESRDQVVLTPVILKRQIEEGYGDKAQVIIYAFEEGDQSAMLQRMNTLYKANGIKRILNTVLVYPLMDRIWPSVVINDLIKTEGALLDISQMDMYI